MSTVFDEQHTTKIKRSCAECGIVFFYMTYCVQLDLVLRTWLPVASQPQIRRLFRLMLSHTGIYAPQALLLIDVRSTTALGESSRGIRCGVVKYPSFFPGMIYRRACPIRSQRES